MSVVKISMKLKKRIPDMYHMHTRFAMQSKSVYVTLQGGCVAV